MTTLSSPLVSVPVLSTTTLVALAMVSINFASLKSNPLLAKRDIPTKLAIGVANANAQGHAMTITEIATINACSKVLASSLIKPILNPKKYHAKKVINERIKMVEENLRES